ncbi:MAG TPA: alanine--glyoxylate aminotransferase [Chloroflexi bacterium]|nr:alanine--glyoxylate aminotransferase [Chloroflexota bacterium]
MTSIPYRRLNPPERTLFGPDLSNASPRARQGLIACLEGANDPDFLQVFELARTLLRNLWHTENDDTFIFAGTEEAGMEAVLVNLLEPDDTAVVGVAGYSGERLADAAERTGAQVIRVTAEWGTILTPRALEPVLAEHRPRLMVLVHGEASTGVLQPLSEIAELAHRHGALCVVDVSSTTALVEVQVDTWGLDGCWTGSQKGLSAYPGLALVTFSPRAARRVEERQTPVRSWYFDLAGLRSYASDERRHQTVPAPLIYALTEMLELAYEQSMAYREGRHRNRRDALVAALEVLGLEILASPKTRLPSVTVVRVPEGIDGERVRHGLLRPFRIDIGGGLGRWKGRVWRVGIQSHSAQPSYLVQFVSVFEYLLAQQGYPIPRPGAAVQAVIAALEP